MAAERVPTFKGSAFDYIPDDAVVETYKVGTGGAVKAAAPVIPDGLVAGSIANAGDAALNIIGLSGEKLSGATENKLADHPVGQDTDVLQSRCRYFPLVKNADTLTPRCHIVAAGSGQVRKFVAGTDNPAAIIGRYLGHADFVGTGTNRAWCSYNPVGGEL